MLNSRCIKGSWYNKNSLKLNNYGIYTRKIFKTGYSLFLIRWNIFTDEFARENNLTLDYSIKSLDELEGWILSKFKHHDELIAQKKLLDYITIYIGQTFRKHIGVNGILT